MKHLAAVALATMVVVAIGVLRGAGAPPAGPREAAPTSAPATAPAKVPVIYDTDIGGDIDDTWALVMLLNSPRLDVRLITTTWGSAESRARLIAKLLTVAGRTDIPIAMGAGKRTGTLRQQAWIQDFKLADYRGTVRDDGARAIVETIRASDRPVTVISVGPQSTVAAALRRHPKIAPKADYVGMVGSVRLGYRGSRRPAAEWNARADPAATRRVLSAPWRSTTITPLDTCGLVVLTGRRFHAVRTSTDPLAAALIQNYRVWLRLKPGDRLLRSSTLFDTVAVYLAGPGPKRLVKFETLRISVTGRGMTRIDPAGTKMRVATAWRDLGGYCSLLSRTLLSGAYKRGRPGPTSAPRPGARR